MDSNTRNIIDRLWLNLATEGISNPLEAIEQITFLLFIKSLDDAELKREKDDNILRTTSKRIFDTEHQNCRWSVFRDFEASKMHENMQQNVFPFIKSLGDKPNSGYAKYMSDAMYKIPTAQLLQKLVDGIDSLPNETRDTKGDIYEYMLKNLSTSGKNGQFRTPRHIIDMMVELMKPDVDDVIMDPACGTAGFLVSSEEYLRANHQELFRNSTKREHFEKNMFFGYDNDRTMLRISAMNLMQHGIENPNIDYKNSITKDNLDKDIASLILANPPFKGTLDETQTADDLLRITKKAKRTELLFLALFLRLLKTGGRCASIVPEGVLFGVSNSHKSIRKEIIENHKLDAIISMPSGVFKPYAGVSTAIMIFTKTGQGGTDKVWFYDMTADGFSLDDHRQPIKENDIPDIIERFSHRYSEEEQNRARTEKSFFVPKEEIVENEYNLSINTYKEIVIKKKEYENPKVILKRVIEMEDEIQQNLKELEDII